MNLSSLISYITLGIIQSCIVSLLAVGFMLSAKYIKFMNFSYAGFLVLPAYFFKVFNLDLFGALLFAIILTVFIGVLLEYFVFKKFRKKENSSQLLLISSLGAYIIIENIILLLWGSELQVLVNHSHKEEIMLFNVSLNLKYFIIISSTIIILVLSWILISKTQFGLKMRALKCNEELYYISGKDRNLIYFGITAFAIFLVSISGILIAYDSGYSPFIGLNYLFLAAIVVFVGGSNIKGIVLLSLAISIIQNLLTAKIPYQWVEALTFLVMLVVLYVKPEGVFEPENY